MIENHLEFAKEWMDKNRERFNFTPTLVENERCYISYKFTGVNYLYLVIGCDEAYVACWFPDSTEEQFLKYGFDDAFFVGCYRKHQLDNRKYICDCFKDRIEEGIQYDSDEDAYIGYVLEPIVDFLMKLCRKSIICIIAVLEQ